jgi:hypothetical protein
MDFPDQLSKDSPEEVLLLILLLSFGLPIQAVAEQAQQANQVTTPQVTSRQAMAE